MGYAPPHAFWRLRCTLEHEWHSWHSLILNPNPVAAGVDTTSPIRSDVGHAVTGHRTAAAALLFMHELPVARVDEVSALV